MGEQRHSILSLSSLLLFFLFVLLSLPVLIESAQAYRASVEGQDQNNNLYTAENYIITKFRQYDHTGDSVQISELGDGKALVFTDYLGGIPFETSLYLSGTEFKELFTQQGSQAGLGMGTTLAELSGFDLHTLESGLILVELTDLHNKRAAFVLNPGSSSGDS